MLEAHSFMGGDSYSGSYAVDERNRSGGWGGALTARSCTRSGWPCLVTFSLQTGTIENSSFSTPPQEMLYTAVGHVSSSVSSLLLTTTIAISAIDPFVIKVLNLQWDTQ
jgi:hypothetical protein